jgi:hypothetical protein
MLGWGLLCYWSNPLAIDHTHFVSSLAIKAKGCNRPAVRDAVALLNFGDFENCGVASVWDSDPGDHIGLIAAWKFAS